MFLNAQFHPPYANKQKISMKSFNQLKDHASFLQAYIPAAEFLT